MVNLAIPEQYDDPALRDRYLDFTYADNSHVLTTVFEDALYNNPLTAIYRSAELAIAKDSGSLRLDQHLSQDAWKNSEFYREGLTIGEDGITVDGAAVLAERFDYRKRRDMILSRARQSSSMTAAQFGVGFLGSLFDPLAVGAAFVPGLAVASLAKNSMSVGRAARAARKIRYKSAKAAVQYGRTPFRLATGGATGAIEAAGFETFIYGAAKYEQDNTYTAADSFMNIVFGTALGGGLHAVTGKVGDIMKRTSRRAQHQMLETATGELATKGRVESAARILDREQLKPQSGVKPRYAFDPANKPGMFAAPNQPGDRPVEVGLGRQAPAPAIGEEVQTRRKGKARPSQLRPAYDQKQRPKNLLSAVLSYGGIRSTDPNFGDIAIFADKKARVLKNDKSGLNLDEIGLRLAEDGYFIGRDVGDRPTVAQVIDAIQEDWDSGASISINQGRWFSEADDKLQPFLDAEKLDDQVRQLGIDPVGLTDEQLSSIIEVELDKQLKASRADAESDKPSFDDARSDQEAAEAAFQRSEFDEFGKRMRELMEEPYYQVDEGDPYGTELQAMIADINQRIENDELPADTAAYLAEADELIQKAENHDYIAYEAVTCMLGKL